MATIQDIMGVLSGGKMPTTAIGVSSKPSFIGGAPKKVSDEELETYISLASQKHGIPKSYIRAIIERENSGHYANIKNPKSSATGMMQLIDSTAKSLGVSDPTDPLQNIMGGTAYLKQQLDTFGDIDKAVAAYFQGPGAIQSKVETGQSFGGLKDATGTTTEDYLSGVKDSITKYQQQYGEEGYQPGPVKRPDIRERVNSILAGGQQREPVRMGRSVDEITQILSGAQKPIKQPEIPQGQAIGQKPVEVPQAEEPAPGPIGVPKKEGFLEGAARSAVAGVGNVVSGFYSIPAATVSAYLGLTNIFNKAVNLGAKAVTGKPVLKDDYQVPDWLVDNSLVQVPKKVAEEQGVQGRESDLQGKNLLTLLGEKKFADAGKYLSYWVLEQAPTTAGVGGMIATGVPKLLTLSTMGALSAGQKEVELHPKVKSGEISQTAASINTVLNGVAEAGFEAGGQYKVLEGLVGAFKNTAKDIGEKQAKQTFFTVFKDLAKGFYQGAKTEVPNEMATQYAQDLTDIITGANPDLTIEQMIQNQVDVLGGTILLGGGPGMATAAVNQLNISKGAKNAEDLRRDQGQLRQEGYGLRPGAVEGGGNVQQIEKIEAKPSEVKAPQIDEDIVKKQQEQIEKLRKDTEVKLKAFNEDKTPDEILIERNNQSIEDLKKQNLIYDEQRGEYVSAEPGKVEEYWSTFGRIGLPGASEIEGPEPSPFQQSKQGPRGTPPGTPPGEEVVKQTKAVAGTEEVVNYKGKEVPVDDQGRFYPPDQKEITERVSRVVMESGGKIPPKGVVYPGQVNPEDGSILQEPSIMYNLQDGSTKLLPLNSSDKEIKAAIEAGNKPVEPKPKEPVSEKEKEEGKALLKEPELPKPVAPVKSDAVVKIIKKNKELHDDPDFNKALLGYDLLRQLKEEFKLGNNDEQYLIMSGKKSGKLSEEINNWLKEKADGFHRNASIGDLVEMGLGKFDEDNPVHGDDVRGWISDAPKSLKEFNEFAKNRKQQIADEIAEQEARDEEEGKKYEAELNKQRLKQVEEEGMGFQRKGEEDTTGDLFAGTEFEGNAEAKRKALERAAVKEKQAERKGGAAELTGLPLFRNKEIAGTEQMELDFKKGIIPEVETVLPKEAYNKVLKGELNRALKMLPKGTGKKVKVGIVRNFNIAGRGYNLGGGDKAAVLFNKSAGTINVWLSPDLTAPEIAEAMTHELPGHYGQRVVFAANPGIHSEVRKIFDSERKAGKLSGLEKIYARDLEGAKPEARENKLFDEWVADKITDHIQKRSKDNAAIKLAKRVYDYVRMALIKMGAPIKNVDDIMAEMVRKMRKAPVSEKGTKKPSYMKEAVKKTEKADTFFSPTLKAVQGLKQTKGTGDQMFAMITKTPGVKEAEWKWMGLDDFLKGKQSVTRQEIEEFVMQNQVRVEEVEKGGRKDLKKVWDLPSGGVEDESFKFRDEDGNIFDINNFQGGWTLHNERGDVLGNYETIKDAMDSYGFTENDYVGAMEINKGTKYSQYTLPGGPLSRDTEILTDQGWKRIDSVGIGEVVLSRSDDGILEWVPIEAKPQVYAPILYHFNNLTLDMQVTPCHQMVVRKRIGGQNHRKKMTVRMTADELWKKHDCNIPLTGKWTGYSEEKIYGLDAGDVAEFIGWYLAEGSYKHEGEVKNTIQISQSKDFNPEKCKRLEMLFDRLNLKWKYYKSGPTYGIGIRTMPKELKELLHAQPTSGDKYVPKFFFKQSKNVIKRLLDGLILGDGCIVKATSKRKESVTFFSKSKQLADDVQVLSLLSGKRSNVNRRPSGLYEVHLCLKEWATVDDAKNSIVEYNDYAFCVTVKNHAIYVRRNGKAAFTGNSNYREVLLTLPPKYKYPELPDDAIFIKGGPGYFVQVPSISRQYIGSGKTREAAKEDALRSINATLGKTKNVDLFKSSHWDEPNVIAHIRLDDRTGPNGEKVLFVEEIQSDYSREARKKGVADESRKKESEKAKKEYDDFVAEMIKKYDRRAWFGDATAEDRARHGELSNKAAELEIQSSGVPAQPFLKNWEELTLKRVLRMAAEEGYDRVAWINGEQTADRYDLSKQIDQVQAWKKTDGSYDIRVTKGGREVYTDSGLDGKELSNIVGKDLAEKIVTGKGAVKATGYTDKANNIDSIMEYRGLDLKIGGEWASALYDRMIPKFYEKYGKKWGTKVEPVNLGHEFDVLSLDEFESKYGSTGVIFPASRKITAWVFYDKLNPQESRMGYATEEGARKKLEEENIAYSGVTTPSVGLQQSITITPEMKESVLYEGQPMFMRSEEESEADYAEYQEYLKKSRVSKLLSKKEIEAKKEEPKYTEAEYSIPVTPMAEPIKSVDMVNDIQGEKTLTQKIDFMKASQRTQDHISWNPTGKKNNLDFLSRWEKGYTDWKDLAFPIQKVQDIAEKDGIPIKDAENIDYGIDQVRGSPARAKQWIDDKIKPIYNAIPSKINGKKVSRGAVYAESVKYMVAKRSKDLYEMEEKGYVDGGYDKATADSMVDFVEVGSHPWAKEVQRIAESMWDITRQLRQMKLDAGIIDDELFDSLTEEHYVPFFRDVDKPSKGIRAGGGDKFTATSKGIMRIKGSLKGSPIIDPVQGVIQQVYETIQNVARAKVANTLVDLAERSEAVGELIKELPPKWIKAGTIEHRGAIDMLLRPQIEALAEELGIKIEYTAKLAGRVGGRMSKVLGLFSEDRIKALVGATEGTLAHELGHGIHRSGKYGWLEGIAERNTEEMNLVADSRYEGQEVPVKFVTYVRSTKEKIAEFISMYVNDRVTLKEMAPAAFAEFESKIKEDPVLKKMIDMKPSNVSGIHSIEVNNFVRDRSIPRDQDVISVLREGHIKSYRVPMEVADAIKNLNPSMFPAWFRVLMLPTKIVRAGAVGLNVDFIIPNIFRDQMDAAINAKTIPFVDFMFGLKSFMTNDENYRMYNLSGGGMESAEAGIQGGKTKASELQYGRSQFLDPYYWKTYGVLRGLTQAAWYTLKSPFRGMYFLAEASEMSSRLGTFRRARKGLPFGLKLRGGGAMSTEAAIHVARQATLDFQRFGKYGKGANEIIPFINAGFEGIDKMFRTFKDDPKRAILKSMVYCVLPMIGLYLLNRKDERYKAVPFKDKLLNWIIMKPDGGYWKIPKGHITRWVVNTMQVGLELVNGDIVQDNPAKIVYQVARDLSPVDYNTLIPPTIKLIVEPITNYDLYWQSEIEKPSIRGIPIPGERWDARTSGAVKYIGKALNISPIMMQHTIESLGAGMAKNILWAADVASGRYSEEEIKIQSIPIARRFNAQLNEWNTDIDRSIREINKTLAGMNEISMRKMIKSYGHTPKDIAELRRRNTEFRYKMEKKRAELMKAKNEIKYLLSKEK